VGKLAHLPTYLYLNKLKIKVMTKQQTVELLKQQLPGFYSVEQVIKMIDDIEDNSQTSLDEDQLEEIADDIYDEIRNTLRHMSTSDIVDTDTAEFSLYDKTIELDSVEIDTDSIADTVIEEVKKVMWDKFLPKVAKQEVVTA